MYVNLLVNSLIENGLVNVHEPSTQQSNKIRYIISKHIDIDEVLKKYECVGLLINNSSIPLEVGRVAYGLIYEDKLDRFTDGVRIHTSTIKEIEQVDALAYVIKTRNSSYFVVNTN